MNCLAAGMSAERLSFVLATSTFAVTADWCQGEIPDHEFLDRACELMLIVVAGSTRGKINLQARRWLEDLREGRASWISLRKLAESRPAAHAGLNQRPAADRGRQVARASAIDTVSLAPTH